MEKRVLIAVILSFIVLYAYQAMFPPPKPAPGKGPAGTETSAQSSQPAAPASAASPSATTAENPAQTSPSPGTPAAAPILADRAERDITVENPSVSAVFTNRGGALKSWRLKKYQDAARQPLELDSAYGSCGNHSPVHLGRRRPSSQHGTFHGVVQAQRGPVGDDLGQRNTDLRIQGRERACRTKTVRLFVGTSLRHRFFGQRLAVGQRPSRDRSVGTRDRHRRRGDDPNLQSSTSADLLSRRQREPDSSEQGCRERGSGRHAAVRRSGRPLFPRRHAAVRATHTRGISNARRAASNRRDCRALRRLVRSIQRRAR